MGHDSERTGGLRGGSAFKAVFSKTGTAKARRREQSLSAGKPKNSEKEKMKERLKKEKKNDIIRYRQKNGHANLLCKRRREKYDSRRKIIEGFGRKIFLPPCQENEEKKTNPVLGYRTAGSWAELATGEMLKKEMETIGLFRCEKRRDHGRLLEFQKAQLNFRTETGVPIFFELGAYQTQFETDGKEECSLVYVGKGTEKNMKGLT